MEPTEQEVAEVLMVDVLSEISGFQKSVSDIKEEIASIRDALIKHGIMTP